MKKREKARIIFLQELKKKTKKSAPIVTMDDPRFWDPHIRIIDFGVTTNL